jgi:Kef-type K+ transport system membrane component KefB
MTRNQALAALATIGAAVEIGSHVALRAVGASNEALIYAALFCMIIACYLVGVIGVHYERKEIERGEDPERRRF